MLERYTITATQQADGSFKVADDAAWTRDGEWADNWDAYDKDPTVGLTKNGVPANTQRTQTCLLYTSTYIIRTSETVANRLIKPTLNTWTNDATAYQRDGFYYDGTNVLVADNDLRYVSGSARTYPCLLYTSRWV